MSEPPLQPPSEPSQEPPAPPSLGLRETWSSGWSIEPFETREVRKARERADRAARRASRAARRLQEAQERTAGRSGARQLVDAAGDAATAALTAMSTAADEAQARLAAKARMRELEHAVVTARAGGSVEASPPTRDEALKLADRVDPGSSGASAVRGLGFIIAGIVALAMTMIGGFGWLGFVVPIMILIASGSMADRIRMADRSRKASLIQIELARASLASTDQAGGAAIAQEAHGAQAAATAGTPVMAAAGGTKRPRLLEDVDPRTGSEVLAVVDRLVTNVRGLVPETDMATLLRIRHSAELALPAADGPLDLADHETWLLRQICIDYLPGALEHFIALRSDLALEPVLDGRSARQVLDEQLALIESRLDAMAARSYRREADGLITHGRFIADSLRPDPFQERLAELGAKEPEPLFVVPEPVPAAEASAIKDEPAAPARERA